MLHCQQRPHGGQMCTKCHLVSCTPQGRIKFSASERFFPCFLKLLCIEITQIIPLLLFQEDSSSYFQLPCCRLNSRFPAPASTSCFPLITVDILQRNGGLSANIHHTQRADIQLLGRSLFRIHHCDSLYL